MAAEMSTRATAGLRTDQVRIAAIDHPVLTDRRDEAVQGVSARTATGCWNEHRIGGVAVMPGTAHLEVRPRGGDGAGRPPRRRRRGGAGRLSFLEPLAVPDGATARYRVTMDADGDFQILGGPGRPLAEFRGRWVERGDPAAVDVEAIRARCRPVLGEPPDRGGDLRRRWDACARRTPGRARTWRSSRRRPRPPRTWTAGCFTRRS